MRSPIPDKTAKGEDVGPHRRAEAGHFGQPPGDERGLGVVAEAEAVEIPAASAMTFFSAPPSSTPMTSSLVYTRKVRAHQELLPLLEQRRVAATTTLVVGSPRPTSSAWFGPESTPMPVDRKASFLDHLGEAEACPRLEPFCSVEDGRLGSPGAGEALSTGRAALERGQRG